MKGKKPNEMKRMLPLWLLLVVALGLFVAFSIYEFGGSEKEWMKKGAFKDTLLAEEASDEDSLSGDSLKFPAPEAEGLKEPAGPDSIKHLLLFGDSMTILVGNRMAYYGAQNNFDVTSVTWYSSSTKIWGECDTLKHFIRTYNPDFIVVTLGANELFIRDIADRQKYVKKLMADMGDIPFVWVGPPNWKKDTGINDMLEETVGSSRFFRTDGMKLSRISDNVHPTQKAADLWADSIMRWIESSRHPIVANYPDTVTKKPKHTRKLLSPLK